MVGHITDRQSLATLFNIRQNALKVVAKASRTDLSDQANNTMLEQARTTWSEDATWYPSNYRDRANHALMLSRIKSTFADLRQYVDSQADLKKLGFYKGFSKLMGTTQTGPILRGATMTSGLEDALFRDLFSNQRYDGHVGLRIVLMRRFVSLMIEVDRLLHSNDPKKLKKIEQALTHFPPQAADFYGVCPASHSDSLTKAHSELVPEPERIINQIYSTTTDPYIAARFIPQLNDRNEEKHLPFLLKALLGFSESQVLNMDQHAMNRASKLNTQDVARLYVETLDFAHNIKQTVMTQITQPFEHYLKPGQANALGYPDLFSNDVITALLETWQIQKLDVIDDQKLYDIDTAQIVLLSNDETVEQYTRRLMARIEQLVFAKLSAVLIKAQSDAAALHGVADTVPASIDWQRVTAFHHPDLENICTHLKGLQRYIGKTLTDQQANEAQIHMTLDLLYIFCRPTVANASNATIKDSFLSGLEVMLPSEDNIAHIACRASHINAATVVTNMERVSQLSRHNRFSEENLGKALPHHLAIQNQDLELIKMIEESGVVNKKQLYQDVISYAVINNCTEMLMFAIRRGGAYWGETVTATDFNDTLLDDFNHPQSKGLLQHFVQACGTPALPQSYWTKIPTTLMLKAAYREDFNVIDYLFQTGVELRNGQGYKENLISILFRLKGEDRGIGMMLKIVNLCPTPALRQHYLDSALFNIVLMKIHTPIAQLMAHGANPQRRFGDP